MSGLITRTLRTRNLVVYRKTFVTLVRPTLDYASSVWSPWQTQDVNLVESVQRTFTRRAYYKCRINRTRYTDRLKHLNITSLEERRIRTDLILVYKILNRLIAMPESVYFRRPVRGTSGSSRNHAFRIQPIIPSSDDPSKNYFSNRVTAIWNSLPREIVNAPTL